MKAAIAASNRADPGSCTGLALPRSVCLAAATVIAAIVLCGWLVPAVGSALPNGWSLMKANTTLAVLLCVASLTLTQRKLSPRLILAGRACASVAVLLAVAALVEHWSGRSSSLGTLLTADSGSPLTGRMSIQSASCFVLLGLSSVIERTRQDLLGHALDVLIATLVMLNLVFIAGYLFDATSLVGQASAIRMSPQTLVCIVLLTFCPNQPPRSLRSYSPFWWESASAASSHESCCRARGRSDLSVHQGLARAFLRRAL